MKPLPPSLAKLPKMYYMRTPGPPGSQYRHDIVFDIRDTKTLVNEYEKREGRIRDAMRPRRDPDLVPMMWVVFFVFSMAFIAIFAN